jgi:pimeloyl-ACP methyl ester carboxylesterase
MAPTEWHGRRPRPVGAPSARCGVVDLSELPGASNAPRDGSVVAEPAGSSAPLWSDPPRLSPHTPVVLVPGAFGQEYAYWNVLRRDLAGRGYRVHSLTFPRLTLSDLTASARKLARQVDVIRAAENAPHVALVGHSLGGLIARYFVHFLGGDESAGLVVCLGVPHRGTVAAATGILLKGARQSVPGSPFLRNLNGAGPSPVPILNIRSAADFVIMPQTSARLEGPRVVQREAPLAGHWGLLVSRQVREWIAVALADRTARSALAPLEREYLASPHDTISRRTSARGSQGELGATREPDRGPSGARAGPASMEP